MESYEIFIILKMTKKGTGSCFLLLAYILLLIIILLFFIFPDYILYVISTIVGVIAFVWISYFLWYGCILKIQWCKPYSLYKVRELKSEGDGVDLDHFVVVK